MEQRTYVVQMLIRHSVAVTAPDDIAAELRAFEALRPDERNRIERWRVCDALSIPLHPQSPDTTTIEGSWFTPDFDWLKAGARRPDHRPAPRPGPATRSAMANITLLTTEHEGKLYGAGACVVTLGGHPIDGVAVRAGDEKRITSGADAVDWLVERGLPRDVAASLVHDATHQD